MHQTVAKIISIVLHPALMPTYLFAILLFFTRLVPYQLSHKLAFLGMIFLQTFICPVLSFFCFLKSKQISSVSIPKREERITPFLAITFLYVLVTYLLFYYLHIFSLLGWVMLNITAVLTAISVITFKHKISVHSAGVSGSLGMLLCLQWQYPNEDFLYFVLLFILLLGTVMSARLALKAHTPTELITGFALGFGIVFSIFYFFEIII